MCGLSFLSPTSFFCGSDTTLYQVCQFYVPVFKASIQKNRYDPLKNVLINNLLLWGCDPLRPSDWSDVTSFFKEKGAEAFSQQTTVCTLRTGKFSSHLQCKVIFKYCFQTTSTITCGLTCCWQYFKAWSSKDEGDSGFSWTNSRNSPDEDYDQESGYFIIARCQGCRSFPQSCSNCYQTLLLLWENDAKYSGNVRRVQ